MNQDKNHNMWSKSRYFKMSCFIVKICLQQECACLCIDIQNISKLQSHFLSYDLSERKSSFWHLQRTMCLMPILNTKYLLSFFDQISEFCSSWTFNALELSLLCTNNIQQRIMHYFHTTKNITCISFLGPVLLLNIRFKWVNYFKRNKICSPYLNILKCQDTL